MVRKPKYFFAVFGGQHWDKHPVDGGVYGHDPNFVASSGIVPGDIVLLYCLGTAPAHSNEIPGIGVVTAIEDEGGFRYQYLPLCHPIDVDWRDPRMSEKLPELAPRGNRNFILKGNFLRQIASSSFRATIAGRQIDWP